METYARVDRNVLARNLNAIGALTGRPILLPVKADAYGHGLTMVATWVEHHDLAAWFGVATVDEGIILRQADITRPILILSPTAPKDVLDAIAFELTLTVTDAAGVDQAAEAADSLGMPGDIHLKIDTGMRRVGVEPAAAPDLAARVEAAPNLVLAGVFTHLAAADDPAEDDFTARQLRHFDEAVAAIQQRLGRRIGLIHAANSAAVLRWPAAWYDLVRPGILSYGYPPCQLSPELARTGAALTSPDSPSFQPVLSLVSHISYVKSIRAGESVGYGRTWVAPTDTRLATIPIGYGDGYSRLLSNQAEVLIDGRRYRQVGRVCMDQIMVDLGPDSTIGPGQTVTLIGRDGDQSIGADELGRLSGTISYEILTGLTGRVSRFYR